MEGILSEERCTWWEFGPINYHLHLHLLSSQINGKKMNPNRSGPLGGVEKFPLKETVYLTVSD